MGGSRKRSFAEALEDDGNGGEYICFGAIGLLMFAHCVIRLAGQSVGRYGVGSRHNAPFPAEQNFTVASSYAKRDSCAAGFQMG